MSFCRKLSVSKAHCPPYVVFQPNPIPPRQVFLQDNQGIFPAALGSFFDPAPLQQGSKPKNKPAGLLLFNLSDFYDLLAANNIFVGAPNEKIQYGPLAAVLEVYPWSAPAYYSFSFMNWSILTHFAWGYT